MAYPRSAFRCTACPSLGRIAAVSAALLTFTVRPALADMAPRSPPAQKTQNAAPPSALEAAPLLIRLEAVQGALEQANTALRGATVNTHGGFVEKARADVALALAAAKAALELVHAHPSDGAPAGPASNLLATTLAHLNDISPTAGNPQPNMFRALAGLKAALEAMPPVADGALGGEREKIIASAAQAADDVIAGIRFADGGRTQNPGPVNRGNGPNAPLVFADPPPVETAQDRLAALQTALQTARLALKSAPTGSPDGFVEATAANVQLALADVDNALAYLRAHPEANILPDDEVRVAVPGLDPPGGSANLTQQRVISNYPTLAAAESALQSGLRSFLNGPEPARTRGRGGRGIGLYGNPGGGGPVMGTLGGFRDQIIRHVGRADVGLMAGVNAWARPPPVPPESAENAVFPLDAQPGAISGVVLDSVGEPVANVLIGFRAARTQDLPLYANGIYREGEPATLTDVHGAFTITGLPPGTYIITASLFGARGGWTMSGSQQPVGVEPAAETRLVSPLKLSSNP